MRYRAPLECCRTPFLFYVRLVLLLVYLTCSSLARYLLVTCLFPRLAYCLLIPTGTTHLLVTCTYLSPAGISHLYFLIILSTISIVYQVIHPFLVAGTNFIRITTYQDILSGNPPTTTSTYLFSYILSCSTPLTTPYLSFFLILISISSLSTTYSSFFLILINILKKPTLFGLATSSQSKEGWFF